MSQTIFIPQGMGTIEALSVKVPRARLRVEMDELSRLHGLAAPHLDPSIPPAIPVNHGKWRRRVLSGDIRLKISGDVFRLTSPMWGSMNLTDLSTPEVYRSNVGYIRFARDIGVVINCKHMPGYSSTTNELPEHYGGSRKIAADWRKLLYLLQLAESEEYIQQFIGLDGLDVYALRYFNGNVLKARSFGINILSESISETLGWKTARAARTRNAYQNKRQIKVRANYKCILSWARDLHGDEKSLPLKAFVKRLLRMDDDHQKRSMSARMGLPFRRFGKIRRSLREGGVDTTELDDIFSQHGVGYREAPALYEEFVALAREKNLSTEQISHIAVERRMAVGAVRIAYSRSGYQILLEAFHDYGIETDELASLLIENAPAYIAGRIDEWHEMPKPRKDLFVHLGLTKLQDQGFVRWVGKNIGEPQRGIAAAALKKRLGREWGAAKRLGSARREDAQHLLADMKSSVLFGPTKRAISEEGVLPLDVFVDLIVESDLPLDVAERLEDVMEPMERIKGPLIQTHLKRLRNIFARELGEELVDAALKEAGVEIG